MTNLVYIYKEDTSLLGSDLKYSLRSLQNFKGEYVVYIVGDIPEWVNTDNIICIPLSQTSNAPVQIKVLECILEVCKILENFVIMDDDMLFINDITVNDIKPAVIRARFPELSKNTDYLNEDIFTQRIIYTHFLLRDAGIESLYTLTSHTPRYYESQKILKLLEIFPQKMNIHKTSSEVIILENLYNLYYNNQLCENNGYRAGYYEEDYFSIQPETKVLNFDNDGLIKNPKLLKFIKKEFSKKSKYEK